MMKSVPDFWFEPMPWIDGRWVSSSETMQVMNPATGEVIAHVGRADARMVEAAIEGASRALPHWSGTSAVERGLCLKRVADAMLQQRDALARLLTAEQGKPYAQALGEVDYAASFFQWFGEESRRVYGRIAAHPEPGREFLIEHHPAGVVGLITPWNFPLAQGAKKIAAALAAGCAAVWKPAERTPLIALSMAPLLRAAGIPDGVLQIVPGPGPIIGKILSSHPAIRVLSLTGSTATGAALMADAAAGIKRVSLELGGNAPFIVLPDADLVLAAQHLVRLKLFVSGQVCVTANRVFVHVDLESRWLELLAEELSVARLGNGLQEGIDAGPLIHAQACTDVGALVDQAIEQGAVIEARNESYRLTGDCDRGSFYPPTLLSNVTDGMDVAQREIFGPVIPVLRYHSIPEVLRRANETPYGLAAYVYGQDLQRCRAVASALEVGIVGVNEWRPLKAEIPFGGIKQSGIGAEGGEEGLREFLSTRVISIPKPKIG
jgi:succinate-semialdehyde dehydrogenase / glutarate-semialdehyde dehydrogenase